MNKQHSNREEASPPSDKNLRVWNSPCTTAKFLVITKVEFTLKNIFRSLWQGAALVDGTGIKWHISKSGDDVKTLGEHVTAIKMESVLDGDRKVGLQVEGKIRRASMSRDQNVRQIHNGGLRWRQHPQKLWQVLILHSPTTEFRFRVCCLIKKKYIQTVILPVSLRECETWSLWLGGVREKGAWGEYFNLRGMTWQETGEHYIMKNFKICNLQKLLLGWSNQVRWDKKCVQNPWKQESVLEI